MPWPILAASHTPGGASTYETRLPRRGCRLLLYTRHAAPGEGGSDWARNCVVSPPPPPPASYASAGLEGLQGSRTLMSSDRWPVTRGRSVAEYAALHGPLLCPTPGVVCGFLFWRRWLPAGGSMGPRLMPPLH